MRKLFKSFKYAFQGLSYAAKTQLNFRIHLCATAIALLLGWYLRISTNDWLWVTMSIALVLTAELLNTAIEILTDMISPGWNEKAGHVKDVSAAAVTITAFFAIVAGCVIFLPKLIALFYAA
ncbi:diacylglycerol kinase [Mucilaginibacter sp. PPCGB 2223]|uniref:diacylglycerol kinase family protein n=1 Tax=Mucilaginibacter sp. PPCGB 2223 TaxID=1886027 RepID=UPI0008246AE8|nr:diacylglycerol kinase family protein [Mucilaginibacter sp. PPCGB 2223]OCX50810.1 diacylglycerol kinase [Mucilaginibacter sp. PPCGB 2223]